MVAKEFPPVQADALKVIIEGIGKAGLSVLLRYDPHPSSPFQHWIIAVEGLPVREMSDPVALLGKHLEKIKELTYAE